MIMDETNSIFDEIDADTNLLNSLFPNLNSNNESNYYDSNKFNAQNFNNVNNFSIINLNIRSITANIDGFNAFINTLNVKFDIITFTESWLNNSTKNLINIDGYYSLHSLRPVNRGGGISIFLKDSRKGCLSLQRNDASNSFSASDPILLPSGNRSNKQNWGGQSDFV